MFRPKVSKAATVVAGAGAAAALQPCMLVVAIDPVIAGEVLSSTCMTCTVDAVFPQASATTYVLVTTSGHVPEVVWLYVTVILASAVQPSVTRRLPGSASSAATVVTAAGASAIEHPSTLIMDNVPVVIGGFVSLRLIVWMIGALVFPHASVTRYVLVITIGHVPVAVWLLVTTRLLSAVHPSDTCRLPVRASSAATVVAVSGASSTEHPSYVDVVIEPVT